MTRVMGDYNYSRECSIANDSLRRPASGRDWPGQRSHSHDWLRYIGKRYVPSRGHRGDRSRRLEFLLYRCSDLQKSRAPC